VKTRPPWFYKQSGVIPYRWRRTELEILLVTSRGKRRWIIPKGLIDPGTSPIESAAKEAYEEAGVKGRANPKLLGEYQYKKWGGTCVVQVFGLEVTKVLDSWPEGGVRQRKWLSKDRAVELLEEADLKKMLREL
jgi:8-oxo-dGTP pyrophosphatase MutT (NUDIX family)